MPRLPILDRRGNLEPSNVAQDCPTLGQIGPYEVRVVLRNDMLREFAVVCPVELRKDGCWNYTVFHRKGNGNLEPSDSDVELDPYHMCLLYQLVDRVYGEEKANG